MSNTLFAINEMTPGFSPLCAAQIVRAFSECSREMQEISLEMSAIITDETSTDDERGLAFDALVEALFPGTASDVIEQFRTRQKTPEAIQAVSQLRATEETLVDRKEPSMKN